MAPVPRTDGPHNCLGGSLPAMATAQPVLRRCPGLRYACAVPHCACSQPPPIPVHMALSAHMAVQQLHSHTGHGLNHTADTASRMPSHTNPATSNPRGMLPHPIARTGCLLKHVPCAHIDTAPHSKQVPAGTLLAEGLPGDPSRPGTASAVPCGPSSSNALPNPQYAPSAVC